jgi:indole-3-glycerol phosphate synthase
LFLVSINAFNGWFGSILQLRNFFFSSSIAWFPAEERYLPGQKPRNEIHGDGGCGSMGSRASNGRGVSALRWSGFLAHTWPVTILETIVEQKKIEVARLPQRILAAGDLRDAMLERDEPRDFLEALRRPRKGSIGLIAEVKKASPSAGVLCPDFDPVRIAKAYQSAGASCLSVLTDEKFFQGSLEYLRQIRAAVKLPLLRKDFIIDERQILEAVEWGADAILLIAAILDDGRLRRFHALAIEAGLAALVEVHDEAELDRAMAIGAGFIGVNNRDLKTFELDLSVTERLAERIKSEANIERLERRGAAPPFLVAESGIHTRADVERLARCGAGAILVGESLVKHGNIGAKVKELLGA